MQVSEPGGRKETFYAPPKDDFSMKVLPLPWCDKHHFHLSTHPMNIHATLITQSLYSLESVLHMWILYYIDKAYG